MILTFIEGPLEDNNYLIYDEYSKDALLIDCTNKSPEIDKAIEQNKLNLKYILLTHGHFDHVLGVNYYREKYGAKSFVHKSDLNVVKDINEFLKRFGDFGKQEIPIIDEKLPEVIHLGNEQIKVIHTPGHTEGSVCFLYKDKLFSGDTLFFESYGRTDVPSGSFEKIKQSLFKIFEMDENLEVFPGHGYKTSIKYEKTHNMIIRG